MKNHRSLFHVLMSSRLQVFTAVLLTCIATACGGRRTPHRPTVERNQPIARPLEVYHRLGFMAGPPEFPAVAQVATLDGPGDSTYVLLSLSLPNNALRFHRDQVGFYAEYRVRATLHRDTVQVQQIDRRETVRVSNFIETSRTEESIIFQDVIATLPGDYVLRLQVNDLNSSRGFRAIDTLNAPAYPAQQKLSPPVIVFEGTGRANVSARPALIVNPRGTIAYGGEPPRVYLELYGASEPEPVALRVVDDAGALLWSGVADMQQGNAALRHSLTSVPSAALPIGRVWLEATPGLDTTRTVRMPLLITISDQWMVANFDEVLEFVRYIAYPSEVDSLRQTTGLERNQLWDRFWERRDPYPAIPGNEFRDQFFQRVRTAVEEFPEPGQPGWKTDRGEVYIVLGPPAYINERYVGRETTARPNLLEWLYQDMLGGPMVLQFFDRTGFGRFELSQSSQAAFITAAHRLRPK